MGCTDKGRLCHYGQEDFKASPTVFPLVVFASGPWDTVDTGIGQLE